MCQNGKNLGFCCGFCEISTVGADLLIRNGTLLRVGPDGFRGKAEMVWMGVEMWERGRFLGGSSESANRSQRRERERACNVLRIVRLTEDFWCRQ
jgi:hypothetical protein